jgi:hypothetical protein
MNVMWSRSNRYASVLAALLVVISGQVTPAQVGFTLSGPTMPSEQELRTLMGGDSAATAVMNESLRRFVRPSAHRSEDLPRIVRVVASQLPAAWLPAIPDVQFDRVNRATITGYRECLRLLWVRSTERSAQILKVTIVEGTKCVLNGLTFRFDKTSDGWRIKEEVPSGFVSGAGHCQCE